MTDERSTEAFVGFAAFWEPSGGADARTIAETFGITAQEYRRRLWWSLILPGAHGIDSVLRRRLIDYARGADAEDGVDRSWDR